MHLNRATAFTKISNHIEALKDCNIAIAQNRQYVKAYLRRADTCLVLSGPENIQKAIEDFEACIGLESDESVKKNLKQKIQKAKVSLKRSKKKDLYAVLGVSQSSSDAEIKKAYRKKALLHHPDKQGGKSDVEKVEAEVCNVISITLPVYIYFRTTDNFL